MTAIRRVLSLCLPAVLLVLLGGAPAQAAAVRPPTGVSAEWVGTGQARVSWQSAGATYTYEVLRATGAGTTYALLGTTNQLEWRDDTVGTGTSYRYVVRSRSATKVSGNSEPAVLPASLAPPGELRHTAYPDRVELAWGAVAGASRYEIRRGAPDGSGEQVVGTTTALSYVDSTVADRTGYSYWIRATDGTSSGLSRPIPVLTGTPTTVTLRNTPSTTETGQWALLTARVTTAAGGRIFGTATFYRDGVRVGSQSVSEGLAERQWAAEAGRVSVDYSGDPSVGLASSGSAPVTQTVLPRAAEPARFGQLQVHQVGLESWPTATEVADVTGDGRADVLMTTQNRATAAPETDFRLWLFAQRADGGIAEPRLLATNAAPASTMRIATGDVDGDGGTDVAVTTRAGVDVFFAGDGTLTGPVPVAVAGGGDFRTGDVRLADLDGDSRADLVVAGLTGIAVVPGRADRTFGPATPVAAVVSKQIEVGEVTGDGRPDVISREGPWSVAVYAQTETGGFQPGWRAELAGDGYLDVNAVAVGDATGDGRDDIAVTSGGNRPTARMSLYAQTAAGGFADPLVYPMYDIPSQILLRDFDGDGRRDALTLHAGWETISLMRQRPEGWFGIDRFTDIPAPGSTDHRAMAAGDVTGDGRPDIVLADYRAGLLVIPQV
ncbi:VCBS repeat-containing protein [Micromonospora sp. PLK6-60]|uniref:FG-GAP repeat domain-containing protein n=1 Tax=Micromonospora sp. PLK6-60 TaxID=2873383 RepID=UPI002104957E|nr:VCBS repeat-containing protein [Micromonospora sp. PLK6-60]